jgi:hypothetical protein
LQSVVRWTLASVIAVLPQVAVTTASATEIARPGVCMRNGSKVVGAMPHAISARVRLPKKVRDVRPQYPDLPVGTTGSGAWSGEFLLDATGAVVTVWVTREPRLTPPFPPFGQAIVDAIKQWKFEPLIVNGRDVPACVPVTIGIHWS